MAGLICIKLNNVKQSPYVSNDFILHTFFIQTVLTTADFDLYCIVLINNQMYILREGKTHLGYTKI